MEERKVQLQQAWKLATEAINHAQSLWQKMPRFQPYKKGEQVWLEGTHLHTSHPTPKLRPKRFGPFEITEQLSSMTYRLNLPPSWKLHNAFHTALLSPYQETAIHRKNYLMLAPKLIDGEWEWEVESILTS